MFVLDNGTNCIGLGKNRPQALKNLWQQFPSLRSSIARWMINVSDTFQYRTNFKTAQITNAFVNVLKMDFNAGVNHFFQRFVSDSEKYILLGLIAIELYNDIKMCIRDRIHDNESRDNKKNNDSLYINNNQAKNLQVIQNAEIHGGIHFEMCIRDRYRETQLFLL